MLLPTNTCVNVDRMNNRNPSNKFSVSSHELCEHSLSYICVLILLKSLAQCIFLQYSSKLQLFSNLKKQFFSHYFLLGM